MKRQPQVAIDAELPEEVERFEPIADRLEETAREHPVDNTMIVCEHKVHDRLNPEHTTGRHDRLLDGIRAENPRLPRIDHGGSEKRAVRSRVRKREGAALVVGKLELAIPRLLGDRVEVLGDLDQRFLVTVADNRYDEALAAVAERHGYAHVHRSINAELPVIAQRAIDVRRLDQRLCGSLDEERRVRQLDAVHGRERIFVELAKFDELANIDLRDRRNRWNFVRAHHSIGNRFAHPDERNDFLLGT